MESQVLDESSIWLGRQILSVTTAIDFVESREPVDYLKLGELKNTLITLYRRARLEDKFCGQFQEKYSQYYAQSGKSPAIA